MGTDPGRRFTLVDAMILVASVAAGMGWIHGNLDPHSFTALWYFYRGRSFASAVKQAMLFVWPMLLAPTLATLVLRVRPPRPPGRRLARQPGLVAGCAATLAVAVVFLPAVVALAAGVPAYNDHTGYPLGYWGYVTMGVAIPEAVGMAVSAAWMTLALGGSWRAERSWVDRLGRALGLCWIALFAICAALHVVEVLRH